ncbi:hypothetical protein TNCV_4977111 [Trichonephila clavipes]|nr:hypothetical protein TNCV_4977111 [Trichonephila clavipes]
MVDFSNVEGQVMEAGVAIIALWSWSRTRSRRALSPSLLALKTRRKKLQTHVKSVEASSPPTAKAQNLREWMLDQIVL